MTVDFLEGFRKDEKKSEYTKLSKVIFRKIRHDTVVLTFEKHLEQEQSKLLTK